MYLRKALAPSDEATKKLQAFENAAHSAAQQLYFSAERAAEQLHAQFGVNKASALQSILTRLRDYDNGLFTDGRAAIWRGRVRLFRTSTVEEMIADSDANLDPREMGATAHISLPAMVEWAIEFICSKHTSIPMGLDRPVIMRRLRSFRSQLSSRRDGTGILRLAYVIDGHEMLARIDVKREMGTAITEVHSALDRLTRGAPRA